jgi:hypothetical protein
MPAEMEKKTMAKPMDGADIEYSASGQESLDEIRSL